ncbi:MAG TPA: type II toxin-antitoxin system death-on-curing family toxin, partial [Polyangiaceae bacterium]|nr:type II toxin-antitoxin system death-on-curing family toxin [Polyangiaceae bacterium]
PVDRGKLEAALQRPQNLIHYEGEQDPAVLAAAYLVAVAKAYAFTDANKRTAWTTAALFFELNELDLQYETEGALAIALGAATSCSVDDVARWYRARLKHR